MQSFPANKRLLLQKVLVKTEFRSDYSYKRGDENCVST